MNRIPARAQDIDATWLTRFVLLLEDLAVLHLRRRFTDAFLARAESAVSALGSAEAVREALASAAS